MKAIKNRKAYSFEHLVEKKSDLYDLAVKLWQDSNNFENGEMLPLLVFELTISDEDFVDVAVSRRPKRFTK